MPHSLLRLLRVRPASAKPDSDFADPECNPGLSRRSRRSAHLALPSSSCASAPDKLTLPFSYPASWRLPQADSGMPASLPIAANAASATVFSAPLRRLHSPYVLAQAFAATSAGRLRFVTVDCNFWDSTKNHLRLTLARCAPIRARMRAVFGAVTYALLGGACCSYASPHCALAHARARAIRAFIESEGQDA